MSGDIEPGRPVVLRGGTVLTMNDAHDVLHGADDPLVLLFHPFLLDDESRYAVLREITDGLRAVPLCEAAAGA